MESIKKFLDSAGLVVLYILFFLLLGTVVQIFSPFTTVLFVLIGTWYGLHARGFQAFLTVSGIVAYVLSWMTQSMWGWSMWEAQLLCGAGIISWMIGVFVPAANHLFPLIFSARRRPL